MNGAQAVSDRVIPCILALFHCTLTDVPRVNGGALGSRKRLAFWSNASWLVGWAVAVVVAYNFVLLADLAPVRAVAVLLRHHLRVLGEVIAPGVLLTELRGVV